MKIAICTPVHGDTRAEFTKSLARMIYTSMKSWHSLGRSDSLEIEMMMASSSDVAGNREVLVRDAEAWGADWILWADADQTFPPWSLLRLLSHQQSVVVVSSPKRHWDAIPSAVLVDEKGEHVPVWTTPEKVEKDIVETVSYAGFSLALVAMDAIRPLERPIFAPRQEDMHFFVRLRAAGHHIWLDHKLSWEVGPQFIDTLTHALALDRKRERRQPGGSRRRR